MAEAVLRLAIGHPRRMAGRALILAYHNVVPDHVAGLGDQSLHLPLTRFLRQLDLLERHCQIRSLADILTEEPFTDGPRVALTFDDAYRGAVELALPELCRRGLPSTMFIAPGLLGARSFWWDELATHEEGLPDDVRRRALEDQAGRHDLIRDATRGHSGSSPLPACYACATETQIRGLDELELVTLGAHTWSHPNLCRTSGGELMAELTRPLDWLRSNTARARPWLAYPYGMRTPEVEAAAKQAGYTAALLVEGASFVPPAGQTMAVPRYNVPAGLSDDGFILRLSGHFLP